MATTRRVYWDACSWISLIQKEKIQQPSGAVEDREMMCKSVIEAAKKNRLEIATSAFCLAEVCKSPDVRHEPSDRIADFFENDYILISAVDTAVGQRARKLMTGGHADFRGKYYSLGKAELNFEPCQERLPPLYSAGTSEAGLELAARHVDCYIMWADPVDIVARRIDDLRKRAMQFGRSIRFGIRVHFIVRETESLAWETAKRLMSQLSEQEVQRAIRRFEAEESSAQKISFALHQGDVGRLEIAPNLWAGVSLARGGALTALVGDPETIQKRLREYEAAGVDLVIGSATPHLEEAEVVYKYIIQPSLDN